MQIRSNTLVRPLRTRRCEKSNPTGTCLNFLSLLARILPQVLTKCKTPPIDTPPELPYNSNAPSAACKAHSRAVTCATSNWRRNMIFPTFIHTHSLNLQTLLSLFKPARIAGTWRLVTRAPPKNSASLWRTRDTLTHSKETCEEPR